MKNIIKRNSIVELSLITFLLTCIIMTIIYALTKIYPFGTKSILTMDMSGQYVNFLSYFRNIFYDGANIFYNFSMNLGSNAFGFFAYYISSPLNIILCFFKQQHILEAILVLNIIKIGLCAVTMTIYLKNTTRIDNTGVIILSIMYALMSYNIVYSQNIMWLDGVIYLPMVILGINRIIQNQKYLVYIIFLVLCIFSNFYIGYMVGLFSVIYFIANIIINSNECDLKNFFRENKKIIFMYIKATIITLLISMIILLPVLINLMNSKSEINQSEFTIDTYYSPLDAVSKMVIGAFDNNQLCFGPPNIYCGAVALIMTFLYFMNDKIKNKERVINLFLMLFLILAFIIIPLNLVFHMLQSPVWFPFRYSFILSFMMILLSARNMEHINGIKLTNIFKAEFFITIIILLLQKLGYSYIGEINTILTVIFILITGIIYYYSVNKRKIFKLCIILLVIVEMIINGYSITKQIGYVDRESFISLYSDINETISNYKSKDNQFYRIENKIARSINDVMLFNYNGFSHYSSTSGKDNKQFLTNFGIRHNLIIENKSDTTLPMSSLLGVKYYILKMNNECIGQNLEWYEEVDRKNDFTILENKYNLSLGFIVNNAVKDIKLQENSPLNNQNELFAKMSNQENTIFDEIELTDEFFIENNNEELYLVYTLQNSENNSLKIYFDDKLYRNSTETNVNSNNILYIPNTVKTVRIQINEENKENFKSSLFRFSFENFKKVYDIIKENQLNIQINHTNYIKGEVTAKEDGVLLTSIIYDKAWKVKIDGKSVQTYQVAENLLAVDITSGKHTVEYTYVPSGFILGTILFLIGILLLIVDIARKKGILLKMKELINKYKELIKYLIIGVLTTAVNYVIFAISVKLLHIDMHISNIIAWIISVIFAYFTNKLFVFESKSFKIDVLVKEIISFGAARVLSLLLEELILFVFVNKMQMDEMIIKLIANVIVIIINYILSKFIIFRNKSK